MPTVSNPAEPTSASSKKSRKKSSRRTLWLVLTAVVVTAGAGTAAYFKFKGPKPTPVTTDRAIIKTITHLVTATGKVQPEIEVKIAPEVTGEIVELPLREGAAVKKGDLLVKIKPDNYRFQFEQAEANVASAKAAAADAKARLVQTEADFRRSQDLYAKKLVSDADFATATATFESAQAGYENAIANIRRAEGSLAQARDLLNKTVIYSPIDGTVSSLTNEVGERVAGTGQYGGAEVMRVADLQNMEVRVKVNENDIVNVKIGDHAVVTIDAFVGRKFAGTVSEISNSALATSTSQTGLAASASDEVTNFLVRIRITDRNVPLRPGMSATVDIETDTVTGVVAVPIQSVTVRAEGGKTTEEIQKQRAKETKERTGSDIDLAKEREESRRSRDKLQRVIFIKQGNTVKMQGVETGIADNTHIEIKSGVKVGDEIIAGTYAAISRLLKDGSRVVIEKPKPEGKP
ncbi:MAG: efflux RND transporter periplasmic adaptor subunit [Opitutaceae bacterium]|nr:efflux RND transporter periplasmic adaptor subunit [Opitutaceae bacterium]